MTACDIEAVVEAMDQPSTSECTIVYRNPGCLNAIGVKASIS